MRALGELGAVEIPHGVYVPIVEPSHDAAFLDRVTVEDAPGPEIGDREFRQVVDQARQRAWSDVGGTGDPRPCWLRLRYCEHLCCRVTGSSVGLSAWIAFVEHYSGLQVPRICVATGWPGRSLGDAEAKLAAVEREREFLGDFAFLLSGDGVSLPQDAPGQLVRTTEEAAARVWGFMPWLADFSGKDIRRLQVQCGDRPPPSGWAAISVATDDLAPEDLHEAVIRVKHEVRGASRVALRVAGPQVLSAALGHSLRNVPTPVVLFHQEEPWWWNRSGFGRDLGPSGLPTEDRYIVFTTGPEKENKRDGEWEILSLAPGNLTRSDFPRVLRDVLRICSDPRQRFHIATTCGQAFAFAVGDMFARSRHVAWYHHRADTGYSRWFANFEKPWLY